eukprot:gnl/MRDRNA2_/MRDRNA2_31505_c0_seq1.p1 gnl/MRDRNA2_/MRDRNA2_31505_c0~~gnl/MRDRNA2_/MRDRNA2_31505_c0_seq1.p1  ORF type:complete len:252 (+),score=34.48 gnl/MRDRNA2_/MRDRNA2_31505_c0_seq1:118-873(+)
MVSSADGKITSMGNMVVINVMMLNCMGHVHDGGLALEDSLQNFADQSVNKLISRALTDLPLQYTGLQNTTISKAAAQTAAIPDPKAAKIMAPKAHGTCPRPVEPILRWQCDQSTADRICCFNRRFAENRGYFEETKFLSAEKGAGENGIPPVTFYDSVTGKPLFVAPKGRSWSDFVAESVSHGWPSFRDDEVIKENMIVLQDGEAVSVDGTHLGHNLPDRRGNRYCINLVSVAGYPPAAPTTATPQTMSFN